MRWTLGEEVVSRLISEREIQRVPQAGDLATSMLEAARSHLASVTKIQDEDPEGAYALCYDAARKACAALLQAQGLRATSRGGHIALRDAVIAQFGGAPEGRALRRLDHLRRRRNVLEYGGQPGETVTLDELDEALTWTTAIVEFSSRVMPRLDTF
ncbi:hypothetical protein Sru01_43970 [Sphaerisporangium rufum]|uniref:HEPN domain-containing protein n=1 Tax=Sphaerisporangium rufum TaxID=1381558 RepID=A0A919R8S6_9ACTN|nr:hypothetical protein [Sphaerisporangium rufum]GII79415.1 hypothetical protein Sru01_43970 [Sphaerisporangium rufum]